jgi:uncharacterized protein YlxW (UPF0749 family)
MPDETPLPPTSEPSHPLPAPPEVARPEEAGSDAVTPDDEDPGSLAAGKTVRSEQEQPGPGHEPELRETGGQEPAVTMAGVGHEVAEAGVGAEPDPAEPDPAEVPVVGAVPSGHTESEGAAAAPVPETTLVAGEAGEGGLDSGSPYAEGEPGSVGEYPTAVPEPGHIATSTPVEPEGRPCDEVVPGGPERDEDSLDEGHLGGGRQALADDEVTDDEIGRSVLAEEEFAAQLGPVHQAPAGGDDGVDDRFAEDEPPTEEPPTDEPPTEEPPTDEPPTEEPPTEERDGRAGGFDAASAGRSALDRGTGPASSFPRGLPDGGGGPAEPARGPEGPGGGVAMLTPRMRLLYAMRPRASRAQLLAMLLCFVLGLAGFLAVKQNQSLGLASMRQSDLVSLLDNVTEKSTRLEDETRRLQAVADRLRSGSDKSAAALQAAQQRLELLGILAGTSPAVGPGIELTITDPRGQVSAAILLDTVQELRDAGAEAIQIGDVRVVASTSFVDGDGTGGVRVDGKAVPRPYVFVVIGDSQTLSAALGIPGGVLEMLKQEGATGKAEPRPSVTVSALRTLSPPQHARPAMSAEP